LPLSDGRFIKEKEDWLEEGLVVPVKKKRKIKEEGL
jgi:hypothetical protein